MGGGEAGTGRIVSKMGGRHTGRRWWRLEDYLACRILLVCSTNGNQNGILLNRIPFPFVFIKKVFESSISVCFREDKF